VARARILKMAVAATVAATVVATTLSPAQAGGAGRLFRRLNRARAAAGAQALVRDAGLTAVARQHSRAMAHDHVLVKPAPSVVPLPPGSYVVHVAMGPSSKAVARTMMRGPDRRSSILDGRWTDVGVGVARDRRGRRWATLILGDPPSGSWEVRETRPEPPPPPPGVQIPSSIPADCSRDVTDDLIAWIASVPNGSTLVFQRHGCYRAERTVEVTNRVGLTFFGNGAYFKRFELSPPELRYPKGNAHWRFVGGSNISIQWMGVEGTNTVPDQRADFGTYQVDFEFEHAYDLHGVSNMVIEHTWADAIWGDGITFSGTDQWTPNGCRLVRVSDFVVDRNGRQGITLANVDDAVLEDVEIWHSRRSGFDMEPPPGGVHNVEIRSSYVNPLGLAFASAGAGDVSNVYIHHNTIDGEGVPWVYVKDSQGNRRHDWRVWDNQVLNALGSPMAMLYFVNVDNVDVRRNVSHTGTASVYSRKAVEFRNAQGSLNVLNNDFTGACGPYVADAPTAQVQSSGNVTSPPDSCA
jgi:hypothetical protein